MRPLTDVDLLRELEPIVAANLTPPGDGAGMAAARVGAVDTRPRLRRRSRTRMDAGQSRLSEAVQAAFEVNLLTEDNLPSYHHELACSFGRDSAWGAWVRRWTAEEARHAMSIRDYLMLSRAVDPVALERDRMATMQSGLGGEGRTCCGRWCTSPSRNSPRASRIATPGGWRRSGRRPLLARIAADENLHMVFYRDLIAAALSIAPEQTLVALAAESGVPDARRRHPGFLRKSVQIAEAGIYDVAPSRRSRGAAREVLASGRSSRDWRHGQTGAGDARSASRRVGADRRSS